MKSFAIIFVVGWGVYLFLLCPYYFTEAAVYSLDFEAGSFQADEWREVGSDKPPVWHRRNCRAVSQLHEVEFVQTRYKDGYIRPTSVSWKLKPARFIVALFTTFIGGWAIAFYLRRMHYRH